MSNPVNPPPQLRIPDALAVDRETFAYFRQVQQILFQLWTRTGGSDDIISDLEESGEAEANTSRLYSTIFRLEKRIDDLEGSNDNEVLNSKIAKLNAKVNKLISELIDAVKANAPDRELETKMLCIQKELVTELKLLNARSEDAWETDIERNDV